MIEKNLAASRLSAPEGAAGSGEPASWAQALLRSLGRDPELLGRDPELLGRDPELLGRDPELLGAGPGEPPDLAWARSGSMALCGDTGAAPRLAPAPLASRAEGALRALQALAGHPRALEIDGAALLSERAAVMGLHRRGAISPSGSCRLLRARDAWLAVNLAREDDRSLLPAWLGEADFAQPWHTIASRLAETRGREALARARLLGLPVAPVSRPPQRAPDWFRVATRGQASPRAPRHAPLVLDLSSLWAGPLCTHLLGLAGARVVKLESTSRPDGARFGPPELFRLLNAGKQSVALDLRSATGIAALHRLIERADIVVESARPRALAQLGIDASTIVNSRPGLSWLSITGYGRREPNAHWVAFGDDASAAAGLVAAAGEDDAPIFCGDAIADPLTGLHAAVAAYSCWQSGGGALLDLSLRDVTACVLAATSRHSAAVGGPSVGTNASGEWQVVVGGVTQRVEPARARPAAGTAPELGADTHDVLRELGAC